MEQARNYFIGNEQDIDRIAEQKQKEEIELAKVKSVETVVSDLMDCGLGCYDIKEFATSSTRKLIAA